MPAKKPTGAQQRKRKRTGDSESSAASSDDDSSLSSHPSLSSGSDKSPLPGGNNACEPLVWTEAGCKTLLERLSGHKKSLAGSSPANFDPDQTVSLLSAIHEHQRPKAHVATKSTMAAAKSSKPSSGKGKKVDARVPTKKLASKHTEAIKEKARVEPRVSKRSQQKAINYKENESPEKACS